MAHESFEDQACADVMNELFVNIKVDREERPDIDAIYQSALVFMGQPGGWPLTMFLAPDGQPFWGGTYYPNPARYGQPGFPEVLRRVSKAFNTEPGAVDKNRAALAHALNQLAAGTTPGELSLKDLKSFAKLAFDDMDTLHGGTRGAPKFPRPALYELLWREYLRTGDRRFKDVVILSLDNICQGGIYDHLGGGFARYSTDELWLAPHFEKMLYDNGSLLDVLRMVWQETRNPLYETRIRETADWLLRVMVTEGGAFAASIGADSEGAEGRFYVWSEAEIDAALGEEAVFFKSIYDVSAEGNWEGTNILHRLSKLALEPADKEARLATCRSILVTRRAAREHPATDDKALTDWNGLAIRALALAGLAFGEDGWIKGAKRAYQFIVDHLSCMEDPSRLYHSFRAGQARFTAVLDDYVNMIGAALGLHEATADPNYLTQAQTWAEALDQHYRDTDNGGYFFTADDAEALISRSRTAIDTGSPSGNGAAVGWLARLYYLTGNTQYRDRADEIVSAFAGDIKQMYHSMQTLINGFEDLANPVQVVIIGRRTLPGTMALLDIIYQASVPNLVLSTIAPGALLPAGHPAAGKSQEHNAATAYVCIGATCSLPITSPSVLHAQLRGANKEVA